MTPAYKPIDLDIRRVDVGVIAHGVNCKGVMGSGIALVIKKKWPIVFTGYKDFIERTGKRPLLGEMQPVKLSPTLWVVNCFTQNDFGTRRGQRYASVPAITMALASTFELAYHMELPVYMPRIGCVRGGLGWAEIEPLVQQLATRYASRVKTYVVSYGGEG